MFIEYSPVPVDETGSSGSKEGGGERSVGVSIPSLSSGKDPTPVIPVMLLLRPPPHLDLSALNIIVFK